MLEDPRWALVLAGVMFVGCGGKARSDEREASPAFGTEVLVEGEGQGDGVGSFIAVDERYVYWASSETVRRAPLEGGEAVTLATGQHVNSLLVAGEFVYYSESEPAFDETPPLGAVHRVPRDGGAALRVTQAKAPTGLAASADTLYWTESELNGTHAVGSIWSSNFDGSGRAVIAAPLPALSSLVVDDSAVYFAIDGPSECPASAELHECARGGVYRVPHGSRAPELLHTTKAVEGLVVNERGLYWIDTTDSPPKIMGAPAKGGERQLAEVPNGLYGPVVVADEAALYWSSSQVVGKLPIEGGEMSRIASGLELGYGIAVRDGWVYVADRQRGRILRIATDGSANRPQGPITGPCVEPLGTPEERALTPRADQNLERLALRLDGDTLTARQTTYERVVEDVAAIRGAHPELAGIGYVGPTESRRLLLSLNDVGALSLRAGEYSAWDCMNAAYGVESVTIGPTDVSTLVEIELGGIYDLARIELQYANLPEVVGARTAPISSNATSEICATRSGDRYDYVIDRTSGECPGLCYHEAHHFVTNAGGQVIEDGVWRSHQGEPHPDWFRYSCP
jgi:hypothetical protein